MACSTTPLSCLLPSNIFAGVFSPSCGGFADPSKFQAERAVFKNAFIEQINNYGVDINYYVNGFNLSACNILYGEQPTQIYSPAFIIRAYLELEESVSLSRFGMSSDDTLTLYIPIDTFSTTLSTFLTTTNSLSLMDGLRFEPKSDDLIEVTALGCDRPGTRGSKIFKITEVLDQSVNSGLNPIMGHYIWKISSKRYESSMETNAPQELGNDQVYDNTFSGKLSSTIFPTLTSNSKLYTFDIDTISKSSIFDMSQDDTNIYGTYY